MSFKELTEGEMKELRAVLQGKDGTVMWKALDRMNLSPKDRVSSHTVYIKKLIISVLLHVGCGLIDIIVPNFCLSPAWSPALRMFILLYIYTASFCQRHLRHHRACTHRAFVVCTRIHRRLLLADGNHLMSSPIFSNSRSEL